MIPLFTTGQVREIDKYAIEIGAFPSILLMENAAFHIAEEITERIQNLNLNGSITFVCGKGNNGGDGFAAARHLANKNYKVNILSLGKENELSPDAKINYKLLTISYPEVPIRHFTSPKDLKILNGSAVVVDCILGSGSKGDLSESLSSLITELNEIKAYKIAVDIPTGLNADNGSGLNVFNADVTVTLAEFKRGLFFNQGYAHAGEIIKKDIGVNNNLFEIFETEDYLIEPEDVLFALPEKNKDLYKYSAGKVFTIAGSKKLPGASILTSKAVLKSGAGASVLAFPDSARGLIASDVTEIIVETYKKPNEKSFQESGYLSAADVDSLSERIEWADVVAMGPGLGREEDTVNAVQRILKQNDTKSFVLDADAIYAINEKKYRQFQLRNCILTPHIAEFSSLIGLNIDDVKNDLLRYGKEFSINTGAILVLKGAPTIIFNPDGESFINTSGNAGLAKFGTGDVLTGIIAGLFSQMKDAEKAAICGVYLHSLTADLLKEKMTEYSYTASDIINNFSKAIKFLRDSFV